MDEPIGTPALHAFIQRLQNNNLPHELDENGPECYVAHYSPNGELLPPCKKCKHCRGWVIHGKEGEPCKGRENEFREAEMRRIRQESGRGDAVTG